MDLGANIVNAGNYSMRPHAFSPVHFETEVVTILVLWKNPNIT